jgi:hypothetical protein
MPVLTESAIESPDWQLATKENTPVSLVVQKRAGGVHIFPWMRFVWAEGDNNTVKLAFASHVVTIKGQGLAALLVAVAAHGVFRVIEPTDREVQFGVRGNGPNRYSGPSIQSISVDLLK